MNVQRLLQGIGILIFLSVFLAGSLVIFTFGALSFTALSLLWVRRSWQRAESHVVCSPSLYRSPEWERVNGVMLFLCAIWFYLNVALDVYQLQAQPPWQLYTIVYGCALLFPPLISHVVYLESAPRLPGLRPAWHRFVLVVYLVSFFLIGLLAAGSLGAFSVRSTLRLGMTIPALFVVVTLYCVFLLLKLPETPARRDNQRGRRWTIVLLLGVAVLSGVILAEGWMGYQDYISVLLRAAPLYFLFIGTYYNDRFEFFDVFIKGGILFCLFSAALAAYAYLAFHWLEPAPVSSQEFLRHFGGWLGALTVPMLAFLVYRFLRPWLNHAWFGRRFSPGEAVRHFLSGIQASSFELGLVERSRLLLEEIFQTDAEVILEPSSTPPAELDRALEIPIQLQGERIGHFRLGRRRNDNPYFSEDIRLLGSLAEVFATALANIRLQEKEREQAERERELRLHASRSELKALRAQINPHFLFNALNAIAGLVHKDPERAEETVEQLAAVFRHTLTRSDKEWVRLEDEIELVRSYLGVEQARFGDRLEVSIHAPPSLLHFRVPTMALQTLVENAVKHGIARLRAGGRISVDVRACDEQLRLTVIDNGPGFRQDPLRASVPETARTSFGLRNVRERLDGYFGKEAVLRLERDREAALTTASIQIPLHLMTQEERQPISG